MEILLGIIHIWCPWRFSNFQDLPPRLVYLHPKFLQSLDLGRPISNEPSPRLQLITNLLKEDIIQRLLLCYQVLPSGRLSFSFGWSLIIRFYVALYFCVCSCPKISRNVFYLFLVLILQSTCFICTTWKRKQTLEQQLHDACDRTKSKQQNQARHIQIDHAFYCSI